MTCCRKSRCDLWAVVIGLAALGLFAWSALSPRATSQPVKTTVNGDLSHDWPMFGGTPVRNMVNTIDKNIPTDWIIKDGAQKHIKWVARLGSTSYGGPVIAGGKVFVGTNNEKPRDPKIKEDKGVLMCFRETDGEFLWQAVHDKLDDPMQNDYPQQGIASTPVVEGNRVYYVSNRCELVCADTDNGSALWKLDMVKELGVFPRYLANCSPVIAGDLVFVITANGVDDEYKLPAPKAPSFVAVDKLKGTVKWQDNTPGDKVMDGQWSNPTYAVINSQPQVIFAGGDGWVRGFEPTTGKHIWEFDCNPKDAEFKPGGRGTRNGILATPVVYDDKMYIAAGLDPESGAGVGHMWCVDITRTGDLSAEWVIDAASQPPRERPLNDSSFIWQTGLTCASDLFQQGLPNARSGVVWHYGGPVVPKPEDGSRDIVFGRTLSTCAVHDGLVYLAELEGFIHCLDAKSGKKYWDHDMKGEIWGSASWVDGKVYLGNLEGDVYIFAHGKEKKLLNKVEMKRGIKSTAVVANSVLYVMNDMYLYAIAGK